MTKKEFRKYWRDYWRNTYIAAHRRGINDHDWARKQPKGPPRYAIGDVMEFKEGGFGVIDNVSDKEESGWPVSYSTANVAGMEPHATGKVAWHYELDFKRCVAKAALRKTIKGRSPCPN